MENYISVLAKIAFIDRILDDFEEELGDLPKSIKQKEAEISNAKQLVAETEQILNELRLFVATAKTTLVTLKEKEDKLSQQQFSVRNNKEFDAITNEIKALKDEHEKLSVKMRTEGIKETNLLEILEKQKKDVEIKIEELAELNHQLDDLTAEQTEEVQIYNKVRKKLRASVDDNLYDKYAVIRRRLHDAAVTVSKNSCMGCYRAIPQQIIVEMRNQPERIFQCESCGRILIPEWVEIDENEIVKLD
jgi:predicted  nucleic acid-binding Zn-ribbon protein